ncbi:HAMP domain-containing histidine kinase [Flavobacterium sp. I-SCBP12n]|uniref:histidine kinase n=2 Tax=Flavobacterium pygoscelis TaxID=2893176 RepID=A0A9X2BMI9_9FLAO|nr:HAMP domain-containing sensor histidine kinase [Flavobacterium pygoscelis]MCK8142943.1 HAMP domain-containing histidine kinase [Flavobacterium pygoscelis]
MKLLTKTSRYYILYTIPVILFSSLFIYFFLLNEIGESNQSLLLTRVKVIENHLAKGNSSVLTVFEANNEVYVQEIDKNKIIPQTVKDTLMYSDIDKEYISNKMIEVNKIINGKNYHIKVWKSNIELDELMEVVFVVFIILLLFLLLITVYINIRISKLIWAPFLNTLTYIKNFNVQTNDFKKLESNDISEFSALNSSINGMTSKMITDYKNQKKFAENASHEFQTPLAIIKGKIDLLLQDNTLKEETMQLLVSIEEATSRLSRINKSLLLLSKIENQQFIKLDIVAVLPLIEKIKHFNEDFILDKNIDFVFENSEELDFKINSELCFILINNLIQNAIRHNIENGKITIAVNDKILKISNTGAQEPLNEVLIFERFEKKSYNTNSIGLGLAIVKQIAEANSIDIHYKYENKEHVFYLHQF